MNRFTCDGLKYEVSIMKDGVLYITKKTDSVDGYGHDEYFFVEPAAIDKFIDALKRERAITKLLSRLNSRLISVVRSLAGCGGR